MEPVNLNGSKKVNHQASWCLISVTVREKQFWKAATAQLYGAVFQVSSVWVENDKANIKIYLKNR